MNETLESPQPKTSGPSSETTTEAPRTRKRTSEAPRPDLVGAVAHLDGSAAHLSWEPLPGVQEYHVQVAQSPRFDELAFDASVGDSTSVTLYELLPTDGARFQWRVRARTTKGWTPFSPSAAIKTVSDNEAEAWQQEHAERKEAQEDAGREGQLPPDVTTTLPYETETTSVVQAAVFVAMVLVVIIGLLLFNFL